MFEQYYFDFLNRGTGRCCCFGWNLYLVPADFEGHRGDEPVDVGLAGREGHGAPVDAEVAGEDIARIDEFDGVGDDDALGVGLGDVDEALEDLLVEVREVLVDLGNEVVILVGC